MPDPPEQCAAEAHEQYEALYAEIQALEPLIGWKHMDRLLCALGTVVLTVRHEAIARFIAGAPAMVDYPIGIIVTGPDVEEEVTE